MKVDFSDYKYAESFIEYFKQNIKNDPGFAIEAEVAEAVVGLMKKQAVSQNDLLLIKDKMRNIEEEEHYDGSGWHVFDQVCLRRCFSFHHDPVAWAVYTGRDQYWQSVHTHSNTFWLICYISDWIKRNGCAGCRMDF